MQSRADAAAAKARYDEGEALVDQEKWDEALAVFRAAVELDPESYKAWWGIALSECGKNGGAATSARAWRAAASSRSARSAACPWSVPSPYFRRFPRP